MIEEEFDKVSNARDLELAAVSVAKALLRAEMTKRSITYAGLADLLYDFGIEENAKNLRNKMARGTFTAAWYFSLLMIMGVRTLDLSHLYTTADDFLGS